MISIRNGMFETNSSSNHVFIYDPNEDITVEKTVVLTPNSDDTMLDKLFNTYYLWFDPDREYDSSMKDFLCQLALAGVTKVKCSDHRIEDLFNKCLDMDPNLRRLYARGETEEVKHVIWGKNVQVDTMRDIEILEGKIQKQYGEDCQYYSLRLS